jgi:LPS export ABC transporter protein LptC
MSSPIETGAAGQPSLAHRRIARAKATSGITRYAGHAAALVALCLAGLFLLQSGVFSPREAEKGDAPPSVEYPDQMSGTGATINGLDRNQRRFEIQAAKGQQDAAVETLVHMQTVAGNFERGNGGRMDITSRTAKYDTKSKALELEGDVNIVDGKRMTAVMDRAEINTDNQTMRSLGPVTVNMQGATIKAGSLTVEEKRVLFKSGVKARFMTKSAPTGDGG